MNYSQWYGLVRYDRSIEIQRQMWAATKRDGRSRILGFEHPPVITLGRRGQETLDVDVQSVLPIIKTDRGGQATLHSPGQLVIYPIVNLKELGMTVNQWVEKIAQWSCDWLAGVGVEAFFNRSRPGIYTSRGKIGFIGMRIKEGVSYHGISINIHNDLSLFQQIRSCGEACPLLDQLSSWGIQMTSEEAFLQWCQLFLIPSRAFTLDTNIDKSYSTRS